MNTDTITLAEVRPPTTPGDRVKVIFHGRVLTIVSKGGGLLHWSYREYNGEAYDLQTIEQQAAKHINGDRRGADRKRGLR